MRFRLYQLGGVPHGQALKADTNIVILNADKGNAIVILDRENYQQKMYNILHDSSKFKVLAEDLFNVIIRKEDKVNKILTKLKNNKEIFSNEYNLMYASETKPGILYGLPKVHKRDVPLRPILSAIGTAGYNIAKFFVSLLSIFTNNEFTINDTFSFVKKIVSIPDSHSYVMASFDIKKWFE